MPSSKNPAAQNLEGELLCEEAARVLRTMTEARQRTNIVGIEGVAKAFSNL